MCGVGVELPRGRGGICFNMAKIFSKIHLDMTTTTPEEDVIILPVVVRISVSCGFVTTELVSLLIGGRIGTDTGCAGCRRVDRTVSCEENTHCRFGDKLL